MYWPIGTPNAYTLPSEHQARVERKSNGATTAESRGRIEDDNQEEEQKHTLQPPVTEQQPEEDNTSFRNGEILAIRAPRGGEIFATITRTSLTVWQTKPTVPVTTIHRSASSLEAHGQNIKLYWRPDATIIVVQTDRDFLLTYAIAADPIARVYALSTSEHDRSGRYEARDVYNLSRRQNASVGESGPGEINGVRELHMRFQSALEIQGGISCVIAADDELIVAARDSTTLQTIIWKDVLHAESLSKSSWKMTTDPISPVAGIVTICFGAIVFHGGIRG